MNLFDENLLSEVRRIRAEKRIIAENQKRLQKWEAEYFLPAFELVSLAGVLALLYL